jgi:hypothetical protein
MMLLDDEIDRAERVHRNTIDGGVPGMPHRCDMRSLCRALTSEDSVLTMSSRESRMRR